MNERRLRDSAFNLIPTHKKHSQLDQHTRSCGLSIAIKTGSVALRATSFHMRTPSGFLTAMEIRLR